MSEEGTGKTVADGDLLPDLNLKSAADSIAEARARLELRQRVGRELRSAIKHVLEAQEKIEGCGTVVETRLALLEAIRLIGVAETVLKSSDTDAGSGKLAEIGRKPAASLSRGPSEAAVASATRETPLDRVPRRSEEPITIPEPEPDRGAKGQSLSAIAAGRTPTRGDERDSQTIRSSSPATVPGPPTVASSYSGISPRQDKDADAGTSSRNRRAYRRVAASYPIQLQPPYNESSNSDLTQLPISGITLNLSRGGMLAQVAQGTLRHGRYLIRFLGAGKKVKPDVRWGRVRRSRAANDGWEVGIEFDSPLEILKP